MKTLKKTISVIVALCFLISNVSFALDGNLFNLSAPTQFTSREFRDAAIIETNVREIINESAIDLRNIKNIVGRHDIVEKEIFNINLIGFLDFTSPEEIELRDGNAQALSGKHYYGIASIEGVRYACIISVSENGEHYEVNVSPHANYIKAKRDGRVVVLRDLMDEKTRAMLDKYVDHEVSTENNVAIDPFVARNMFAGNYAVDPETRTNNVMYQHTNAKSYDWNGLNTSLEYVREALRAMGINKAGEIIEEIEGKPVVFIPYDNERELPTIKINGKRIHVTAHSSHLATYIFVKRNTFNDIAAYGKWTPSTILYVTRELIHEAGAICGMDASVDNAGAISNILDELYFAYSAQHWPVKIEAAKEILDAVKELEPIDLLDLQRRNDYASGHVVSNKTIFSSIMGIIMTLLFSSGQLKGEELRFTSLDKTPDGKTVLELQADVPGQYAKLFSTTNDLRVADWRFLEIKEADGYNFTFTNSLTGESEFYKAVMLLDVDEVEYYYDLPQYNDGKGRIKKITYSDGTYEEYLAYWNDTNIAKTKKVVYPSGAYENYTYDSGGNFISGTFKVILSAPSDANVLVLNPGGFWTLGTGTVSTVKTEYSVNMGTDEIIENFGGTRTTRTKADGTSKVSGRGLINAYRFDNFSAYWGYRNVISNEMTQMMSATTGESFAVFSNALDEFIAEMPAEATADFYYNDATQFVGRVMHSDNEVQLPPKGSWYLGSSKYGEPLEFNVVSDAYVTATYHPDLENASVPAQSFAYNINNGLNGILHPTDSNQVNTLLNNLHGLHMAVTNFMNLSATDPTLANTANSYYTQTTNLLEQGGMSWEIIGSDMYYEITKDNGTRERYLYHPEDGTFEFIAIVVVGMTVLAGSKKGEKEDEEKIVETLAKEAIADMAALPGRELLGDIYDDVIKILLQTVQESRPEELAKYQERLEDICEPDGNQKRGTLIKQAIAVAFALGITTRSVYAKPEDLELIRLANELKDAGYIVHMAQSEFPDNKFNRVQTVFKKILGGNLKIYSTLDAIPERVRKAGSPEKSIVMTVGVQDNNDMQKLDRELDPKTRIINFASMDFGKMTDEMYYSYMKETLIILLAARHVEKGDIEEDNFKYRSLAHILEMRMAEGADMHEYISAVVDRSLVKEGAGYFINNMLVPRPAEAYGDRLWDKQNAVEQIWRAA